jgi:O-antigen ligase
MLAGGLLTLALALVPWPTPGWQESRDSKKNGAPRQRGSRAIFYVQLFFVAAFLIYLAIGALNPAWQIVSDERGWWLAAMEPPLADWLPTSVASTYEPMSAWRIFNMHLAAFSLALGLFAGLNRRTTVLWAVWAFVISVSAMACVAILQKYTSTESVLGVFKSENPRFWGSFFYRNQAVAYLNWGIVIAGVLYFYHARRTREEGRSGGPHFLAICLVGLIAVSVALALSRGGILFGAVLVLVFIMLVAIDYLSHAFAQLSRHTIWAISTITLILVLLLFSGLFQAQKAIDWQAIETRFGDLEADIQNVDKDARMLSSRLTLEMAQDSIWTGWGAGSFRYVFPMYQQKIPDFFHHYYHRGKKQWIGRRFFRYAHNDILQFLAEYGRVGSGLLILAIVSFLLPVLRGILHSPMPNLYLLAGVVVCMSHAFFDFIFHSPAYWVALITGIALVGRLHMLEWRVSRLTS